MHTSGLPLTIRRVGVARTFLSTHRANVIRKARIAGAVAHRQRYMTRLALSGWLLRTLLAADFVRRLKAVGAQVRCRAEHWGNACANHPIQEQDAAATSLLYRAFASQPNLTHPSDDPLTQSCTQLNVQLVVDGLEAWREYTIYRRTKKGMLHAALRYWRLSRQRAAMDAMRWYTTRRQLKRAVLLRGRTGAAARALRVSQRCAGQMQSFVRHPQNVSQSCALYLPPLTSTSYSFLC